MLTQWIAKEMTFSGVVIVFGTIQVVRLNPPFFQVLPRCNPPGRAASETSDEANEKAQLALDGF